MTSLSTLEIKIGKPTPDPLARTTIDLGRDSARGKVTLEPLRGADGTNPIAVENAFSLFDDKAPVALGVATVSFSDHGRELKGSNVSGETHHARLTGRVHGIVEDPGR
jgi:hypothetical protein